MKPNKKLHIAIIVSEFNKDITALLLKECLKELNSGGLTNNQIKVVGVPGAYELPYVADRLAASKKFQAIIGLGCVIKGHTSHDHHVATWASVGLGLVSLNHKTPVLFGVLTPNNEDQALERAQPGPLNRGKEVAAATLQLLATLQAEKI